MKRAATLLAVGLFALASAGAGAQTPTPKPSPSPGLGPVQVDGKSTFQLSFGSSSSQAATASQDRAPDGTYFIATPGMLCTGTVAVTGSSQQIAGNAIISTGRFTFTRTGSPLGCAVTISSSAGGRVATVIFQ